MNAYLDIDLDYFVKPVKKEGINNVRLYKDEYGEVSGVENTIKILEKKGLLNPYEKKFFTNHRKSYTYWWIKKLENITLIHIDAHSDMYRNKSMDLNFLRDTDMNCDDYIWYAIRDGFISSIYWIPPNGLYDLSQEKIAEKFIPKEILKDYYYEDEILNILLKVNTRKGMKIVDYKITTIDNLPKFDGCNLMTVATSPEFTPEITDKYIFDALKLLGAGDEDVKRIEKIHKDMK